MAITRDAHRWLQRYVEQVVATGVAHRATAKDAIALTFDQRVEIERHLCAYWSRTYPCPAMLDLKPQHGYLSRVAKDGFRPVEFVEWLVAGCSDVARVEAQANGRPFLIVPDIRDGWPNAFDLVVPITSDTLGYVHVFDVIPKGLRARNKKTAPSAIPKTDRRSGR